MKRTIIILFSILFCLEIVSASVTLETGCTWYDPENIDLRPPSWYKLGKFEVNKDDVYLISFEIDDFSIPGISQCSLRNGSSTVIQVGQIIENNCIFSPAVKTPAGTDYRLYVYFNPTLGIDPYASGCSVPIAGTNVNVTQAAGTGGLVSITTTTGAIEVCTEGDPNSAYTFYQKDEQAPSNYLFGDFEIEIIEPSTESTVFNGDQDDSNNITFCLLDGDANYTFDVYIKYTSDNGFTHNYYLFSEYIDNTTQYDNIYNFNTTTGISTLRITAREQEGYQFKSNAVATLQRKYVDEGVWRNVQMDKSGDFGLLSFHIIEESVDYRLVFSDTDGCILDTTNSMKLSCDDALCELTKILGTCESVSPTDDLNVDISLGYVGGAYYINTTWTDPTGITTALTSDVSKSTSITRTDICSNTTYAADGTVICYIGSYRGSFLVEVSATQSGSNVFVKRKWIDVKPSGLADDLSVKEQTFWTFGIVVTCVMFGLFSPVGPIITMVIGLILSYYLGIMSALTTTAIIVSSVIGLAIGVKVKR